MKKKTTKAKSPKFQIESCKYIPVSTILPDFDDGNFLTFLGDVSHFTWGDNNRSLVDSLTFYQDCSETCSNHYGLDEEDAKVMKWLAKISKIPNDVYIDMEN